MKTLDMAILRGAKEPEVRAALDALLRMIAGDCQVTPAIETRIQNAIYLLRSTSPRSKAIEQLESAAANLRLIFEAKRAGLCNMYESRVRRFRKQLLDPVEAATPVRGPYASSSQATACSAFLGKVSPQPAMF